MITEELPWLSATALRAEIQSGNLSVRDVAQAMVSRVETVNPKINAIVSWDPEQVLRDAAALDERSARGEDLGPLHGVPYTIKDLTPMKGLPVTSGIAAYKDNIGAEDAPVVERLRGAGGLFIGRTNTPEGGYCPNTKNHLFGATRNPWNTDLTPGGSSGGAGAAVAAGFGPLAEGSDGGGSIRVPAALNGVVGLKPSLGRIPKTSGQVRYATHSFHGPLTRTVTDAALMLDVMSGEDPRDPLSLARPGYAYADSLDPDLSGWRIAFSETLGIDATVDPEILAITRAAIARFAEAGATIVEAEPAWGDGARTMWDGVWVPGVASLGANLDIDAMHGQLDAELIELIQHARDLTGADIARTSVERGIYHDVHERFMRDYEILASPTTTVAAYPSDRFEPEYLAGQSLEDRLLRWSLTWPFNLTSAPAISVPCGFTSDGRPVGLQLSGRFRDERSVLRAARAFEILQPWAQFRPSI